MKYKFTFGLLLLAFQLHAAEQRPNIIVVLADDLGYGDLGCYGHKDVHTPHLDRFASQGLRLTACYSAAPVCSPARAGLLTGRTPYRVGVYNWVPMDSPMHLPHREITVAKLLRSAGYATGHVGKWHLSGGLDRLDQPQPSDHGFDHWFATQNNALPNHRNPHNFFRNGEAVGKIEGYAADIVADEAIRWLKEGRDQSKPFFLNVWFHEPHEPIATDPRHARLYPSDDPSYSAYYGNITQMDAAFGRLMDAVDQLGLQERTFVLFTSDNGPAVTAIHPHGSVGPLRARKAHLYEGGIRVPGIVRWPGRIKPGGVSDEPVSGVDLLPTACELAGIEPPKGREMDGASFTPVFDGRPIARTTPLYWQFNWAQSLPRIALRMGDWKLLASLDKPPTVTNDITIENNAALKEAQPVAFELYNLRTDVGETTDLADREPDRLAGMRLAMLSLYIQVQDWGPMWPLWAWPRHEAKRIKWPEYWLHKAGGR